MKHSILRKTAMLGVLTLAATLHGGDVAADDGLPPLDTNQAVRFTVPSAARSAVAYRLSAAFAGPAEQNLDLFMWVQDTNDTGHWQRRAFVNSYWQGAESVSRLRLDAGRTYALALHAKPGPAPAYGQPWTQRPLAKSDTSPAGAAATSPETPPTVRAEYTTAAGDINTVASLEPVP